MTGTRLDFISKECDYVARELKSSIELELNKLGLLMRVFARGKSKDSFTKKLDSNPHKYSLDGKRIQDGIGIRIVLYFSDDIDVAQNFLKKKYECIEQDSSIDLIDENTFSVTRRNLIFKIPQDLSERISREGQTIPIDTTFEVQIRTILSEGWHEAEHDLRYKCKDHWTDHKDMNRALNGVMGTLETCEWSMQKIFEEMAFRHYKNKKWDAMLHSLLRLRTAPHISEEIYEYLSKNHNVAKALYRMDRKKLIGTIGAYEVRLPINLNNMIFLWNYLHIKDDYLNDLTPELILNIFSKNSKNLYEN